MREKDPASDTSDAGPTGRISQKNAVTVHKRRERIIFYAVMQIIK